MPKKKSKRINKFIPPEKKYHLFVMYEEYGTVVKERNYNDEWDTGEQEIHFTIQSIHATEQEMGWPQQVHVAFDPEKHLGEDIFVLVVRYDTGDTFGRTYNAWTIPEIVLTKKEAKEICQAIIYDKYDGYKPWEEYFEHFRSADYEMFELEI